MHAAASAETSIFPSPLQGPLPGTDLPGAGKGAATVAEMVARMLGVSISLMSQHPLNGKWRWERNSTQFTFKDKPTSSTFFETRTKTQPSFKIHVFTQGVGSFRILMRWGVVGRLVSRVSRGTFSNFLLHSSAIALKRLLWEAFMKGMAADSAMHFL